MDRPKPDEVARIYPGYELDRAVHEFFFDQPIGPFVGVPGYSWRWDDAARILHELRERGRLFSLSWFPEGGVWNMTIYPREGLSLDHDGVTGPEAIARAAVLLAVSGRR